MQHITNLFGLKRGLKLELKKANLQFSYNIDKRENITVSVCQCCSLLCNGYRLRPFCVKIGIIKFKDKTFFYYVEQVCGLQDGSRRGGHTQAGIQKLFFSPKFTTKEIVHRFYIGDPRNRLQFWNTVYVKDRSIRTVSVGPFWSDP